MQSAALAGVLTVSRNYSRISFAPFGEQKFFRDSYIYEVPRQNFVLVSFADIFVGGYSRFFERFFPAVFIELFVPAVEDTAVRIREFYYFTDMPLASTASSLAVKPSLQFRVTPLPRREAISFSCFDFISS